MPHSDLSLKLFNWFLSNTRIAQIKAVNIYQDENVKTSPESSLTDCHHVLIKHELLVWMGYERVISKVLEVMLI